MPAPIPPQNTDHASTGLLPQLYQHAIGPLSKAYYQAVFTHFETLGRTTARWNHAAAFCTLGWSLLRGLWRPAGLHSTVALALAALSWLGVFQALPLQARVSLGLLAAIGLCCVPGFLGNGWYYRLVHRHTITALEQSPTLAQAEAALQRHAGSRRQWALAAIAQAALWVLLATLLLTPKTPPAPAEVGPPQLHFPASSTEDVPPIPPQPAPSEQETPPAMAPEPASPPTPAEPDLPPAPAPAETTPPLPAPAPAPVSTAPAPTVPPPRAATARTATPASKASAQGRFFVSIGTYAELTNAAAVEKRVRQAGLPVVSFSSTTNKGTLTRLRAGPFNTRAEAERAQRTLKALRLPAKVLELRS